MQGARIILECLQYNGQTSWPSDRNQIQSARLAEDLLAAFESPPGIDVVVAGFIGAYSGDAHTEKITKVLDGKVNPLVRDAGLSSAF